jgi:hypothetical protein
MKKQLCILSVVSALAFNGAIAQTADLDQAPVTIVQQSASNKHITRSAVQKSYPNSTLSGCTAAPMCPQISSNSGSVRGYYFVAPVSFVLCGLLVPTDLSTDPQSIEVLQFHGMLPPAYSAVTNNFTSLFYTASDTGITTPVSCNILINAGDSIGIYGSRGTSTICSYGSPSCQTTILGNTVTLTRSGMQFPLYNQQMHDVWSEAAADISRVIMYVDAAPTSVRENNETLFSLAPNPSNGILSVKAGANHPFAAGDKLEVYNIMGSKVYESNGNIPSSINLSEQAGGVYFVTLHSGSAAVTKKIVINK